MIKKYFCYLGFMFLIYQDAVAIDRGILYNQDVHNPIRVGVIVQDPFVKYNGGQYSGIAIDIWQSIAAKNHWHYVYKMLSNNTDAEIAQFAYNSDIDIIIGGIASTSQRLQQVEFTRPIFLGSVGLITKRNDLSILNVLQIFFSKKLFILLAIFIGGFIVYINLLWYFERGKLNELPHKYGLAIENSLWLHLFKRGISMPTTFLGRTISLIWLFFAGVTIASISANYVAAYTVSLAHSYKDITTMTDFENMKVAGVNGQVSTDDAEKSGAYVERVKSFDDAINLLLASEVDGVICDTATGINYVRLHGADKLFLNSIVIHYLELSFVTRLDSPIKHKIDLGIMDLRDNNEILSICHHYLGGEAETRCNL